jgi:hypothetical protein
MHIDASNATQPTSICDVVATLSDAGVFPFPVVLILLTIGASFWRIRASVFLGSMPALFTLLATAVAAAVAAPIGASSDQTPFPLKPLPKRVFK